MWKWVRGVFYRGSHRPGIRPLTDPPAPVPDETPASGPAGAGVPYVAYELPPIPGRYQPSAHAVLGALGKPQWP